MLGRAELSHPLWAVELQLTELVGPGRGEREKPEWMYTGTH